MACLSIPLPSYHPCPDFRLRSILLPTDFSAASDRAARLAGGLASHFRSKLQVVHAVWQRDYEWDEAVAHMGASEASGLRRSQEFVATHGLDAVGAEVVVMPGSPTEVVQTIAAEANADLLVLGTNGLPWPTRLLFGTYSEQMYRNARSPVLTVGPYVRPAKCSGDFKSILFAFNPESETILPQLASGAPGKPVVGLLGQNTGRAGDSAPNGFGPNEPTAGSLETPLQYAIALTRAFDARLTIGCVVPKPRGVRGEEFYRVQSRLKAEKLTQLLGLLENVQPALAHPLEIVVESGHISEGTIRIAMRCNADLIVKGVRPSEPQSGGYTYPISVNAPCPVLTVGKGGALKKAPLQWQGA